ncbi:hypothetical protein [Cellulomonas alba]|uniref:CsbD-like domain-containing protein n=1 Tax=Cellulomonas alba TaxID=3053467 RepID=A0ABT7SHT7_9CELL|nr:hypothetical protein [Cellulomonas alba]MDM7855741.1 hypothetical protein [Cellulomonas alba]
MTIRGALRKAVGSLTRRGLVLDDEESRRQREKQAHAARAVAEQERRSEGVKNETRIRMGMQGGGPGGFLG